MIMQHLDDASTYKKLDLNRDLIIHKNLKKLLNAINVSQNLNKNFWMKNLSKLVIFMACLKFVSLKS